MVAAAVADQIAAGNRAIVGVMLESFLVAGRQDLDEPGDAASTASRSPTAASAGRTTVEVLDELGDRGPGPA